MLLLGRAILSMARLLRFLLGAELLACMVTRLLPLPRIFSIAGGDRIRSVQFFRDLYQHTRHICWKLIACLRIHYTIVFPVPPPRRSFILGRLQESRQ